MYMEQIYTKCIAEAAHYIECDGEAAVIDPLRDIDIYLDLAKSRGAKIKYVLETHFHADFVSGHIDLAEATGAPIIFGPGAKTKFKIKEVADNEVLPLGHSKIKVLHTPGHTLESVCYLWIQPDNKPYAIFTGDTLFIGDVGRPDLIGGAYTKEHMAGLLYDSLHSKLYPLADDILVYPSHGAGTACGKNLGRATFSTIGEQRRENLPFQINKRYEFIKYVTDGLATPPAYFPVDAGKNKDGYLPLKEILAKSKKPLSVKLFEEHIHAGAYILDTRAPDIFAKGYIKGALNIGLDGQFAIWVGYLLPPDAKILLITEKDKLEESITRLARIGFDSVLGYLDGGFTQWSKENKLFDTISEVSADQFKTEYSSKMINILDVRNTSESKSGVIKGALNICLSQLNLECEFLSQNKRYYVHCAGGYRSMMACSLLRKKGFCDIVNINGGMQALKSLNLPLIDAHK